MSAIKSQLTEKRRGGTKKGARAAGCSSSAWAPAPAPTHSKNQPNVAILGTGKIKKNPVVIEKDDRDIIAIRSIMMLSLGFDHRLIDGAGGANFLFKVKNHLENIDFESLL